MVQVLGLEGKKRGGCLGVEIVHMSLTFSFIWRKTMTKVKQYEERVGVSNLKEFTCFMNSPRQPIAELVAALAVR